MFSLFEIIPYEFVLDVVDIGAALNGRPPYQDLVDSGHARLTGFEPDEAACVELNRTYGSNHRFYPFFVGDGGPAIFHETNWSLTGSLYPPNTPLLEKFQNLAEVVTLVKTHTVRTTKLDDVHAIDNVDFLKIDVQGGELSVFQNALRVLSKTLVIQTEVEFVELYKGQPMFADVDTFLRSEGFQFHTFNGFGSRAFKPLIVNQNPNQGIRQSLWSDAIYVRDWMRLSDLDPLQLAKYAVLAHDLLRSWDLTHLVLTEHDRRTGTSLASKYLEKISG